LYLGSFKIGETFTSPLRAGDENPSFNVFYSKRNNCLLFKDFAGKRGDFVTLVQELYSLSTYNEALQRIVSDLSLNLNGVTKPVEKTLPVEIKSVNKTPYELSIKARDWCAQDYIYWVQFGITASTLKKFNVVPIDGYFNSSYYVKTPGLAYAYLEYKDASLTYKVYRPQEVAKKKWRNNNPFGVHQGYRQLPHKGNLLIITKALKEVMSLDEVMHVPAIGIQAETCYMKDSVAIEYKLRFKKVVTLFDNDRQGIEQAIAYKKMYDINSIFIPAEYKAKNFSDLMQILTKGSEITKEVILNRLKETIFNYEKK
jgi:hypothetical protein